MGLNNISENKQFTIEHFKNLSLEDEYLNNQLSDDLNIIYKLLIPILGILNFLFIIPDYYNNDPESFIVILLLRLFVVIFSFILYYKGLMITSYNLMYLVNTIYEIVFIGSFLIIAYIYIKFIFTIQLIGLFILIIGLFFVIPNKLLNKIIISCLASLAFYIITIIKSTEDQSTLYASIILSFILIAICIFSIYRIERFKRIIFLEQKRLEKMSISDPLTGIYNKRKFLTDLNIQIKNVKRYQSDFSLIIFDIDYFKNINDKYGHIIGDEILIEITKVINNFIRDIDIFARIGGEEFAIILPNTKQKDAQLLAKRLKLGIYNHSYKNIKGITCSFGVGQYYSGDIINFIDLVDKALYKAKKSGRNKVCTVKKNKIQS